MRLLSLLLCLLTFLALLMLALLLLRSVSVPGLLRPLLQGLPLMLLLALSLRLCSIAREGRHLFCLSIRRCLGLCLDHLLDRLGVLAALVPYRSALRTCVFSSAQRTNLGLACRQPSHAGLPPA